MSARRKPFECREEVFWYLVGLIASDGCLSRDGRHIDITSKDKRFLVHIRSAAELSAGVAPKGDGVYRIQIGSRELYRRLESLGLTPAKSLTIGPLKIPDIGFADFLRGVIDGDGNIRCWRHPTNGRVQWAVRVYSASRPFVAWLLVTAKRLWRVEGVLLDSSRWVDEKHHPMFVLKFGKLAAKVILAECYYTGALALERKHQLARLCAATSVGWGRSKTVHDVRHWQDWKYVHIWRNKSTELVGDTDGNVADILRASFVECDAPGWRNWLRRGRLKISCPERDMWVRLPPPACSTCVGVEVSPTRFASQSEACGASGRPE